MTVSAIWHNSSFRRTAKIGLTLAATWYCYTLIDPTLLGNMALAVRPQMLLLSLVTVVASTALGAVRFKILVDPVFSLSLGTHIKQYFKANYFNLLLPSAIGGDAARVLMLGNSGISKTRAAVMIVLERIMGLVSLLLLSIGGLIYLDLSASLTAAVVGLLVAILGFLGMVFVWARSRRTPARQWLVQIQEALVQVQTAPLAVLAAFLLSFVFQLLNVTVTYYVVVAFGLHVGFVLVLALVPIVWLVTALPVSISGIGVREVSFVHLFAIAGVTKEAAVLMSVTTYAMFIAVGLLGGLWLLLDGFHSTAQQQQDDAPDH